VNASPSGKWRLLFLTAGGIAIAVTILLSLKANNLWDWYQTSPSARLAVEACDSTLQDAREAMEFSGLYAGIVEDSQRDEVQLKLARNGNAIQGSYYRQGLCGTVFGEVASNRLIFHWRWAGAAGRGVAEQAGAKLTGTSGFNDSAEGASQFTLFRRSVR
jgi:hypothetical protein